MISTTTSLQQQYQDLKAAQPKTRIRDAAKQLQVSELELLELELGKNVIRLKDNFKTLLRVLEDLGKVMVLTRNEYAVHERKGIYKNVSFMRNHNMGVAVNPDIDLRFLMWNWKYAYAVRMKKSNDHILYALHFFNGLGVAVHKIYLTSHSNPIKFDKIIHKFKAKDQKSITEITETSSKKTESTPNESVDIAAFQQGWLTLKDTHDFFPLLKKYKLARTQALELAPKGYAHQVDKKAIVRMFELAVERTIPIMIFVNSSGCIQIHTGEIKRLVTMRNWFNIMDSDFNLHLNMDGVAQVWVVKKPTADGLVTGIEVFDKDGNMIVYCFGKRKPGIPELDTWRSLVKELK